MRDYIDRLRAEEPNNRKIRERVIGNNFSNNETTAPLLAPRWTCAGYEGRLKDAISEACSNQSDNQHRQLDQLYSHDDLMELTERERAITMDMMERRRRKKRKRRMRMKRTKRRFY